MWNAVFQAWTLQSSTLSHWDYVHKTFRGWDPSTFCHGGEDAHEPLSPAQVLYEVDGCQGLEKNSLSDVDTGKYFPIRNSN